MKLSVPPDVGSPACSAPPTMPLTNGVSPAVSDPDDVCPGAVVHPDTTSPNESTTANQLPSLNRILRIPYFSARCHADGTVESNGLAVEHLVLNDVACQRRILGGIAQPGW